MRYTKPWERRLWLIAVLGFAALTALLVYQNPLILDVMILEFLSHFEIVHDGLYSVLGYGQFLFWFTIPVLILLGRIYNQSKATWLPLTALPVLLSSYGLKYLFGRPRPPDWVVESALDRLLPYGYPSDTIVVGVFVLGLSRYMLWGPQWWCRAMVIALAGVIVLAHLSVLYFDHHWPSDILGSWLLAGIFLLPVLALHRRWRDQAR